MIVVLGFSQHDRHQAVTLANHIEALGGVEAHDAILICPEGLGFDGIEDPFRRSFRSVALRTYKPTLHGWPQGPNELFANAVPAVVQHPVDAPWLWLEPDCVPTRRTWLAEIDTAHRRGGRLLLGNVVDTVFIDTGVAHGRHTVGVAVYPKMFPKLCPIVRYVVAMSADHVRRREIPKAFDAYFGPYTAPNTAETDLIQHLWRSNGYTATEDGVIRDGTGRRVSEDAAIVHGCKDDTLISMFRVPARPVPTEAPRIAPEPIPVATPRPSQAPQSFRLPERPAPRPTPAERQPILRTPPPPSPGEPLQQPPFAKDSPEWFRECDLIVMPWNKLRSLAAIDYNINTHKMQRKKVEWAVVLYEREHRNRDWSKKLHRDREKAAKETPVVQAAEPRPVADWRSEPPGDGISPEMQAKMLAMRRARGLPIPT